MGGKLGSDNKAVKFKTCEECGGKCCKFFTVTAPRTQNLDFLGYLALRKPGIDFKATKRFGKVMVVRTPCSKLTPDGKCSDYVNRPHICRNMNKSTLSVYCVPEGCKYDTTGEFGEDFGV